MQAAIKILDETPTGKVLRETLLVLASERITAHELIERRVRKEVLAFNENDSLVIFQGLVQPADTEGSPSGYRLKKRRMLDADAQFAQALDAFRGNGFVMLVDDRQIESLEEEIVIGPDSRVSFVKLVPLVGG